MKVTSGEFSGVPLFVPKGLNMRPTLAKTRQAVFNMLRPYISDAVVIDCFAGTGAFGFEALGNGAKKVYFVEKSHKGIIERNAAKLKVSAGLYKIYGCDYKKGIIDIGKNGVKADIVFADPPYNEGYIKKFLKIVRISDILDKDAIVILEVHKDEYEQGVLEGYSVLKEKKYGDTFILLLKTEEERNG